MEQSLNGQQIGDYTVLRPIGEEAMGAVYLGEHRALRQKVSIKALSPQMLKAPGMRERFEREAKVLAKLNHPAITRIQNFYDLPAGCFIVTEYSEGETLAERIERDGPVEPMQGARWMVEVLHGLAYAHAAGVIHRDIKPANIIITAATGAAKIRDFGLSKVGEGPKLTMQGLALGTMHYMSREQLLGKPVDARTDLYSVGVALYEALTGRLPFFDDDEQKLILKIAKHDPPPPGQFVAAIPKELEAIILKVLAKEASKRYASADEMRLALEAVLGAGSAAAAPPRPAPAPVPAPPKQVAPTPAPAPPRQVAPAPVPAPPRPAPAPVPAPPKQMAPAPAPAPVLPAPVLVPPKPPTLPAPTPVPALHAQAAPPRPDASSPPRVPAPPAVSRPLSSLAAPGLVVPVSLPGKPASLRAPQGLAAPLPVPVRAPAPAPLPAPAPAPLPAPAPPPVPVLVAPPAPAPLPIPVLVAPPAPAPLPVPVLVPAPAPLPVPVLVAAPAPAPLPLPEFVPAPVPPAPIPAATPQQPVPAPSPPLPSPAPAPMFVAAPAEAAPLPPRAVAVVASPAPAPLSSPGAPEQPTATLATLSDDARERVEAATRAHVLRLLEENGELALARAELEQRRAVLEAQAAAERAGTEAARGRLEQRRVALDRQLSTLRDVLVRFHVELEAERERRALLAHDERPVREHLAREAELASPAPLETTMTMDTWAPTFAAPAPAPAPVLAAPVLAAPAPAPMLPAPVLAAPTPVSAHAVETPVEAGAPVTAAPRRSAPQPAGDADADLRPLLVWGACWIVVTGALAAGLAMNFPAQHLYSALALGLGVPVGLVLVALGVAARVCPPE